MTPHPVVNFFSNDNWMGYHPILIVQVKKLIRFQFGLSSSYYFDLEIRTG